MRKDSKAWNISIILALVYFKVNVLVPYKYLCTTMVAPFSLRFSVTSPYSSYDCLSHEKIPLPKPPLFSSVSTKFSLLHNCINSYKACGLLSHFSDGYRQPGFSPYSFIAILKAFEVLEVIFWWSRSYRT